MSWWSLLRRVVGGPGVGVAAVRSCRRGLFPAILAIQFVLDKARDSARRYVVVGCDLFNGLHLVEQLLYLINGNLSLFENAYIRHSVNPYTRDYVDVLKEKAPLVPYPCYNVQINITCYVCQAIGHMRYNKKCIKLRAIMM